MHMLNWSLGGFLLGSCSRFLAGCWPPPTYQSFKFILFWELGGIWSSVALALLSLAQGVPSNWAVPVLD